MRHNVKGRKLNRTASHRKALLSNLTSQLFEHSRIVTTLPKAKEARRYADKMITLGKKGDLNSLRQALKFLKQKKIVFKLFNEIAPAFTERQGGYTRVLKLGTRKGDAAEKALLQLVESDSEAKPAKPKKTKQEKAEAVKPAPVVEEVKAEEPAVEEAITDEPSVEEVKAEEPGEDKKE